MPVLAVKLVPFRVKTLATFGAPDPWNNSAHADFTIEAHLLLAEHAVRAPRDIRPPYVLGLRSEIDGRTHFMPESLSELWNSGQAPAEALPRLLKGIEPSLNKGDFRFYLHAKRHIWILAVFGASALAAFLWANSPLARPVTGQMSSPGFGLTLAAPLLICGLFVFIVIRRGQVRRHHQMKQLLAALGAYP